MGCSASHEEPPRQQPSTRKPTQTQAANPHPSLQAQNQKAPQGAPQAGTPAQGGKVTKEALSRYMELEKILSQKNGQNILKNLKIKEEALATQEAHCKSLEDKYKECQAVVEKEKKDVDNQSDQGEVSDLVAGNEALAQEKEQYVEALNKQEIARKELDEAIRQRELLASDVDLMKKSGAEVQALMDEQEDLLGDIFGGDYGSELENTLESEADILEEKKRRIGTAKYKWQNGRILIQYAVNQLAFALKKWTTVSETPREDARTRYTYATETRNNLVAANQNLTSAQRYLNTITFPYCNRTEMETLQRATNNIYTDMQTPDRHGHAANVYGVTHKRSAALLQWFDHVIKSTIMKDFASVKKEVSLKKQELRAERIRLIQEKVKAELGETVEIKAGEEVDADNDDDDTPDAQLMFLAAKTGDAGEEDNVSAQQADDSAPAATPLPDEELADSPSSTDLFGDINELKVQHEKEMEEFKRQQDLNKARIDQGLQEKLARRRSKKRKSENA